MIELEQQYNTEKKEIVICPRCEGTGFDEKTRAYNQEDDPIVCSVCNGSGRRKKITTIKYLPFKNINQ